MLDILWWCWRMWGKKKPKVGLVGCPSGMSVSVPDCSIMSQDVSGCLRQPELHSFKISKIQLIAIVCEATLERTGTYCILIWCNSDTSVVSMVWWSVSNVFGIALGPRNLTKNSRHQDSIEIQPQMDSHWRTCINKMKTPYMPRYSAGLDISCKSFSDLALGSASGR